MTASGLIDTRRAVLAVRGPDARSFLQGILTNNVERLGPETPVYAALLSPQGKVLFDMILAWWNDAILVDAEAGRLGDLSRRLALYRLRAKAEIGEMPEIAVGLLWGADARDLAEAAARENPDLRALPDPRLPDLGYRLYGARADVEAALAAAEPATAEDWTRHRLALGVPEAPDDIRADETFWLEANAALLNGVDFRKGCYVGQEVTARMHHKTVLRKRLVPLAFDGGTPEPGTPLMAGEKEAGTVTSALDGRGIGLVRLDRWEEAETVTAGGLTAHMVAPGWLAPALTGSAA